MDYGEQKSKNFAKYCKEGKLKLVKKWIDNPNVDVNWNKHSPLKYSVKTNQIESIKILLQHPKLKINYENDEKPLRGVTLMDGNPFTEAMMSRNFEVLDLFIKKNVEVKRLAYLNILINMADEELTDYFTNLDGFIEFILNSHEKYLVLVIGII